MVNMKQSRITNYEMAIPKKGGRPGSNKKQRKGDSLMMDGNKAKKHNHSISNMNEFEGTLGIIQRYNKSKKKVQKTTQEDKAIQDLITSSMPDSSKRLFLKQFGKSASEIELLLDKKRHESA